MHFSNKSAGSTQNSSNSCPEGDYNTVLKYLLLPISFSLLFLFGLSLNAFTLFFIKFRTKHWTPFTIYMLNLTVCDTLFVLMLPVAIYHQVKDWPFGEPLCKITFFVVNANHYGSILFLSVISLHRFIGICYPVRSLSWNSTRRAKLVSVGVWACVLSSQAPILYFSGTEKYGKDILCIEDGGLLDDFLVYSSVISVVMFVLPFMVVMVCYGLMLRKLLEPSWGSGEGQQGLRAAHRTKQKALKMIIIVLMTFMFCFLPFHISKSLTFCLDLPSVSPDQMTCEQLDASYIAYQLTLLMASANSIMDPILYFMAGQDFRKTMKKKKQKKAENILPECAKLCV
ncbi:P2Y purinoceptor 2-like [Gadus morhua]|uniref:P2Y purinoceptor 2-like n=1 Tax=Gadus morhua TaxID=8049 RepID=UPI0011B66B52|nr:P2Y purinoceptor 2-like [Gadus morhua]